MGHHSAQIQIQAQTQIQIQIQIQAQTQAQAHGREGVPVSRRGRDGVGRAAADRAAAGSAAWRDPVLLGLAGATLLLAVWFVVVPAGAGARVVMYWLPQPMLDGLMVLTCRRVAAMTEVAAPIRRFWRWLGRAGLLFAVGDTVQAAMALRHPSLAAAAGGSWQATFVGAGVALMVMVILTHPTGVTGAERLRLWLDASTVMVGAAVFSWYLNAGRGTDAIAVLVVSTFVLVCVFGLVKLALGKAPPFTVHAGLVGSTGVASFGVVTALAFQVSDSAHLGAVLLIRLLPSVLIAATPRVQELKVRADPTALDRGRRRPYSTLPYLALAATFGLLVTVLIRQQLTVAGWGVLLGVIVITALVVVRQLAAFRDNAALLRRLDASLLELGRQERRFRSLVQHASDLTVIIAADQTVSYASPAIETTLGLLPKKAVGESIFQIVAADLDQTRAFLAKVTAVEGGTVGGLLQARHADGSSRWLDVIATNLLADPSVAGVVCNARDVTEARRLLEKLHHQASRDPLTQLANRTCFDERMDAALANPDRLEPIAILMIDLDDFKPINDRFGHHAGDELLIQVAARLGGCVRSQDTVARLGGDEFAVLLPGATREHAVGVAERIIGSVRETVLAAGHRLNVQASVGVAVGTLEYANTLLRDADAAMYVAKRRGKGNYHCAQITD